MEERNIEYNNNILDCIRDICESHPQRYNNLGIEYLLINDDDFFIKKVEKYFSTEEIISYKGKEQFIHDYKQFVDNNFFIKIY